MNHEFKNAKGYPDPTAAKALRAIEREEKRNIFDRSPIVYICSPYKGDVKTNVKNARSYSRFAVDMGAIPLAPHLLMTQYLNDDIPSEREIALAHGLALLRLCSQMWVFASGGISSGMASEIEFAKKHDIRMRYFDATCKEVL